MNTSIQENANVSKTNRQSGLDFLRILSMLFVCILHYFSHGGIIKQTVFGTIEYSLYWGIYGFCFVAVNCFVLITGYFLSTSSFKLSRITKTIIHVLFYSVLCGFIRIVLPPLENLLGFEIILKTLTPLSSNLWWYMTCYFQLLVLTPILNYAIKHMSKKQFKIALFSLITITSLIPTFIIWSKQWPSEHSVMHFVTLYFIAAYIRKFDIKVSSKKAFLLYAGSCFALLLSRLVIGYLTKFLSGSIMLESVFYKYNSIIVLFSSVTLFLACANLQIRGSYLNKLICAVAPFTLGVYLIHDNEILRPTIYSLLNVERFAGTPVLALTFMLVFALAILVLGCMCDFVFNKIYSFVGFKKLDRTIDNSIQKYLKEG